MKKEQFEEITKWQDATFPKSSELSRLSHLGKEYDELMIEATLLEPNDEKKIMEYADCFFLLFGAAKSAGFSYEDICSAIDRKFEINKARKWGEPDNNGVVEHIN